MVGHGKATYAKLQPKWSGKEQAAFENDCVIAGPQSVNCSRNLNDTMYSDALFWYKTVHAGFNAAYLGAQQISDLTNWPSGNVKLDRGDGSLSMTYWTPRGWCNTFFGLVADDNKPRISDLIDYICEHHSKTRDELSQIFESMIRCC